MKIGLFKEHHEFVEVFKNLPKHKDYVLINVDTHSDLNIFNSPLNISNWITYCVIQKFFNKIIWVKPDSSKEALNEGFYEFSLFFDQESYSWKTDVEHPEFFFEDEFCQEGNDYQNELYDIFYWQKKDKIKFSVEVISESSLTDKISQFKDMDFILSFDADFLSASNPFEQNIKDFLEKNKQDLGEGIEKEIVKVKEEISKIKTYKDFNEFRKKIILANKWKVFSYLYKNYHVSFNRDNDEIEKSITNVIKFLKNNFKKENILFLLCCSSFFSGYLKRDRAPIIIKTIKTWFENFDYFWDNA